MPEGYTMRRSMRLAQARIKRLVQRLDREATPELPALFVGEDDDGIDDGGGYGGYDDPRAALLQQEAADIRQRKIEDHL